MNFTCKSIIFFLKIYIHIGFPRWCQQLGICLPYRGHQLYLWDAGGPMCLGQLSPRRRNYWACVLEPGRQLLRLWVTVTEARAPRALLHSRRSHSMSQAQSRLLAYLPWLRKPSKWWTPSATNIKWINKNFQKVYVHRNEGWVIETDKHSTPRSIDDKMNRQRQKDEGWVRRIVRILTKSPK